MSTRRFTESVANFLAPTQNADRGNGGRICNQCYSQVLLLADEAFLGESEEQKVNNKVIEVMISQVISGL